MTKRKILEGSIVHERMRTLDALIIAFPDTRFEELLVARDCVMQDLPNRTKEGSCTYLGRCPYQATETPRYVFDRSIHCTRQGGGYKV